MKVLLLTALLVVICHGADAQTPECSKVPKASDRLACYDRATPPSAAKPATSKQKAAASNTSRDQGTVVDALAVENAKLDAKLKKICRGC
jgi:type II secretory pathway component PulL